MKTVTALDVKNGDIINLQGYKVRVSDVRHSFVSEEGERQTVARYRCHSIKGEKQLPGFFDHEIYGGNHLAEVYVYKEGPRP